MKTSILLIGLVLGLGASPVCASGDLYHSAYIGGYPDGSFGPENLLSRGEVAKIIVASEEQEVFEGESFYDVGENHWARSFIYTAKRNGYVNGNQDGSYNPDASIRRGEFVAIVYRTIERYIPDEIKEDKNYLFSDIENHWGRISINALAKLGVIRGSGDGKYNPEGYITRAEAVTIINRVQGRLPDTEKIDGMTESIYSDPGISKHWGYHDIVEASVNHEFYIVNDGKNKQREFWTRFYF